MCVECGGPLPEFPAYKISGGTEVITGPYCDDHAAIVPPTTRSEGPIVWDDLVDETPRTAEELETLTRWWAAVGEKRRLGQLDVG